MLASYTLAEAEAAITVCLAANAAADVDRVARKILDTRNRRLRHLLAIAGNLQTPAWYFNENWHGPEVDDLIRSSELQRRLGEQSRKAAA